MALNHIIKFYLECLLGARPRLDDAGEVLAQIKDDGEAILDCFGEFEDLLPREIVERDVEVVLQVIQLCQVDVEGIVDFWMSKLVKSFGSSRYEEQSDELRRRLYEISIFCCHLSARILTL